MIDPKEYNVEDFTRENYRRLLRLAKEKYIFRSYSDFVPEEKFVIWRHDVDFSMHSALRLAQIEAEEGIQSTYFVYPHSMLYNLFEVEITKLCHEILGLNHHLGLHFDPEYYEIQGQEEFNTLLSREKVFLEELFSCEIQAVSFHNPTPAILNIGQIQYCGMINVYAEYFRKQVGYCSDSSGYWRYRRLENVLTSAEDSCLQVLTHPEWWQDQPMLPYQRILRCIEGRAEKTKKNYQTMLQEVGRENIGYEKVDILENKDEFR
jgi:hypothetical protein